MHTEPSEQHPQTKYLRLNQIIGQRGVSDSEAAENTYRLSTLPSNADPALRRRVEKLPKRPRPQIEPLIPVSRSGWWLGIKNGIYPKPIKLSPGVSVWLEADVMELLSPSNAGK